jgi:hypothetical protein
MKLSQVSKETLSAIVTLLTNMQPTQEQLIEDNLEVLEEYFINLRENGGMAITKDNCEDMFDSWLQDLDLEEVVAILKKIEKKEIYQDSLNEIQEDTTSMEEKLEAINNLE